MLRCSLGTWPEVLSQVSSLRDQRHRVDMWGKSLWCPRELQGLQADGQWLMAIILDRTIGTYLHCSGAFIRHVDGPSRTQRSSPAPALAVSQTSRPSTGRRAQRDTGVWRKQRQSSRSYPWATDTTLIASFGVWRHLTWSSWVTRVRVTCLECCLDQRRPHILWSTTWWGQRTPQGGWAWCETSSYWTSHAVAARTRGLIEARAVTLHCWEWCWKSSCLYTWHLCMMVFQYVYVYVIYAKS